MGRDKRVRIRVRASDRPDLVILLTTLGLVGVGCLFVFGTTYFFSERAYGDGYRMMSKHVVSIALGLSFMFGLSRCRSDMLERAALPLFLVCTALLFLPLIPHVGVCVKGACRWVQLGPLRLQPAELSKVAFVVFLAALLSRRGKQLRDWRHGMLPVLAITAVIAVVLLEQPDFGSAVLIALIGVAMMFLAGVPIHHLLLAGAPAVAGAVGLVAMEPYRLKRFLCFLDPSEDPAGACYQLVQSYRTFGSGELMGVGIGNSVQKAGYLPEAHTDFIFSVIGEEIGFLGACAVLIAFCILALRGLRIAHRHPDPFGQLLAAGVTLALVLQAFINMGVVLGLLPTKGLVLPFVGYGGSSMMVSLAAVGILMSLSRELRER